MVCQWEGMDGIVVPVTMSFLFIYLFPFWGRDADGGGKVLLSSHSSQSTWGVPFFPPFFAFFTFRLACFSSWSLPSLMIQIGFNFFSSSHGPASSACACRV
jgi:hypothetical protein